MHAGIIGAGLAGLVCARVLGSRGHRVTVFDKGRAPGGRMCATRRAGGGHADHGARAFLVHDERFARQIRRWAQQDLVAPWNPELVAINAPGMARSLSSRVTRYVGTPTMHAPVRDLASSLGPTVELRPGVRIERVHRAGTAWAVSDDEGASEAFDAVAVALPAPQAAGLLTEIPHLHAVASAVPMTPCWAVTASFGERLPIPFDAANISIGGRHAHAGVLAWADRESSKPGRSPDECWVLHAGDEWTRDHMDDDHDSVGASMLGAFFDAAGIGPVTASEVRAHRWRYAFPVAPLCDGCLFDEHLMIGACGDWCMGSRLEGAFLSGLAMAGRLLGERSDFLEPCLITPRQV